MMEKDSNTETNGEKTEDVTEENFLKELYFYMKQRNTPIERIPHLGFKQIDLYVMYKAVKELGGYHQVTSQQLWKKVYNILGGNPRSTSAATCTRRHYEKLLLPYEYHLAGYGGTIPISPPRKRFRYDDEYPLSAKHADFRRLTQFNQFMHAGSEPLSYFPPAQSISSVPSLGSPVGPRSSQAYLPALGFDTGGFRQPLALLRHLAEEYKSTSGLVEPLNLSKSSNKMETTSNTPSSFAPPSTKKEPKFLNEAPRLYPARVVGLDGQPGSVGGPSRGEVPITGQAVISPLRVDEVPELNHTSSASSGWKTPTSPTPPLTPRPSYTSRPLVNEVEKSFSPWANKSSPSSAPPEPIHSHVGPPSDPYGGMEIQIPLYLLQKWIKESLLYSSVSSPQQLTPGCAPPEPPKPRASPEPIRRGRLTSETLSDLSNNHPTDLSLKKDSRVSKESSTDMAKPLSSPVTASQNPTIAHDRYASVKPFHMCAPVKAHFNGELYHRGPNLKAPEARKQDTGSRQPHPAAAEDGQASTGLMSPSHDAASALPGAPWSQRAAAKLAVHSPPLVKVNSASPPFIQITPEQLKQLISSSPFRRERRKIC